MFVFRPYPLGKSKILHKRQRMDPPSTQVCLPQIINAPVSYIHSSPPRPQGSMADSQGDGPASPVRQGKFRIYSAKTNSLKTIFTSRCQGKCGRFYHQLPPQAVEGLLILTTQNSRAPFPRGWGLWMKLTGT